ncbi:MAG: type I CRISPR-associated protein Cas7, partial [Atribacterota bacterium]|nr:type I CRISPR-associated protein Cas7 [Atribacterota bacterium]
EGKGNVTFTGPIQFNWGYSLNKLMGPMESSGITSHFQTGEITEEKESAKSAGAMGKDYRLSYSLIAFHGIVSSGRGVQTNLTDDDIKLFDEAMINAIPLEATTRSKMGQCPRLYIRIEYNNSEFFLGDLRDDLKIVNIDNEEIKFEDTANFKSCNDYKLDLSDLTKKIMGHDYKIDKIHFWKHRDFCITGWNVNEDKLMVLNP